MARTKEMARLKGATIRRIIPTGRRSEGGEGHEPIRRETGDGGDGGDDYDDDDDDDGDGDDDADDDTQEEEEEEEEELDEKEFQILHLVEYSTKKKELQLRQMVYESVFTPKEGSNAMTGQLAVIRGREGTLHGYCSGYHSSSFIGNFSADQEDMIRALFSIDGKPQGEWATLLTSNFYTDIEKGTVLVVDLLTNRGEDVDLDLVRAAVRFHPYPDLILVKQEVIPVDCSGSSDEEVQDQVRQQRAQEREMDRFKRIGFRSVPGHGDVLFLHINTVLDIPN